MGVCRGFSDGVDEFGDAAKPGVITGIGGALALQLMRHEQRDLRVWQPATA